MDPVTARTRASYDRIAEAFLARTRDRSALGRAFELFAGALAADARVLDVGCGPGCDAAVFRQRGLRVVGADLSAEMLRVARGDPPGLFVQADMRALPFASIFDGVWANASLLHVGRTAPSPLPDSR